MGPSRSSAHLLRPQQLRRSWLPFSPPQKNGGEKGGTWQKLMVRFFASPLAVLPVRRVEAVFGLCVDKIFLSRVA